MNARQLGEGRRQKANHATREAKVVHWIVIE